jgi:sugar/nucleoside kinase (ribokinase family)
VLPDERTTTFENTYDPRGRRQRVLENARPIGPGQVPAAWRSAAVVLLAPVFHDVDVSAGSIFPAESVVGLSAQGWLRSVEGGAVVRRPVNPDEPWLIGDIVFVSDEDVEDPESVRAWLGYVPMVVLTRAGRGFTVFDDSGAREFTPVPAREVDPTGAGDVFAAAFLVRWHETDRDLEETARFAATAAALSVQSEGLGGIATRAEIEAAMEARTLSGPR